MKKIINLILLYSVSLLTFSQEFSSTIYFSDNAGNTDSIIVGYDPAATDSVDSIFGEKNIISQSWDSTFEVRITDEYYSQGYNSNITGSYHLKKQIVKGTCDSNSYIYIAGIDIYCNNWPVTADWDSSKFKIVCRRGSVLTSYPPGGFGDVGPAGDLERAELAKKNKITFLSNTNWDMNGAYTNNQDTISVFTLIFADKSLLTLDARKPRYNNRITVYPNPADTRVTIQNKTQLNKRLNIQLYNIFGNLLYQKKNIVKPQFQIPLKKYPNGLYFVKVRIGNNRYITKKIIKK